MGLGNFGYFGPGLAFCIGPHKPSTVAGPGGLLLFALGGMDGMVRLSCDRQAFSITAAAFAQPAGRSTRVRNSMAWHGEFYGTGVAQVQHWKPICCTSLADLVRGLIGIPERRGSKSWLHDTILFRTNCRKSRTCGIIKQARARTSTTFVSSRIG